MLRKLCVLAVGVSLALMVAAPRQVAAAVIAADNLGGVPQSSGFFTGVGYAGSPNFTNEASAQGFVAQNSGTIQSVVATVARFDGGDVLQIGVRQKVAGNVGPLLGSASFAAASVPASIGPLSLNTFDLSSAGVSLVAGQSYYLTFTTPTAIANNTRYDAYLSANTAKRFGLGTLFSRDGGTTWETSSASPAEVGITVFVPEPATATLAAAGTVLIAWATGRGRRRRWANRPA